LAAATIPTLAGYWAARRRKAAPPPVNLVTLRLLRQQHGRCPICTGLLLHADHQPTSPQQWEQWLRGTGRAISKQAIVFNRHGPPDGTEQRLTHADCYRHARCREQPPSTSPSP
jgi:RNA-directed DNA polymerase